MADQITTPTPLQLAELVRDLADQLGKATGPLKHPRITGQTIPEASAARVALLLRAEATLAAMRATAPADLPIIEAARAAYTTRTDDIEIDDVPAVARGDGGAWVAAWLWVADE